MESKMEGSKMKTKSQEKAIRAKNVDVIKPAKRTTSDGYMPKKVNIDEVPFNKRPWNNKGKIK
jgi:hypothetical protein